MNRIDIINSLIKKNNYSSYLEIGVQAGHCFSAIQCKTKVGVDPDPSSAATLHITSNEFFELMEAKISGSSEFGLEELVCKYKGENFPCDIHRGFDIVFIDGLHHADQVIKDIENSLKHLNEGGIIVMHDCLPTSKRMQEIPLEEQGEWTGDTWKAFVHFRQTRTDLTMAVVDTDWGCGIIHKGSQDLLKTDVKLTYENFVINKHKWMNIVSTAEFQKKYLS